MLPAVSVAIKAIGLTIWAIGCGFTQYQFLYGTAFNPPLPANAPTTCFPWETDICFPQDRLLSFLSLTFFELDLNAQPNDATDNHEINAGYEPLYTWKPRTLKDEFMAFFRPSENDAATRPEAPAGQQQTKESPEEAQQLTEETKSETEEATVPKPQQRAEGKEEEQSREQTEEKKETEKEEKEGTETVTAETRKEEKIAKDDTPKETAKGEPTDEVKVETAATTPTEVRKETTMQKMIDAVANAPIAYLFLAIGSFLVGAILTAVCFAAFELRRGPAVQNRADGVEEPAAEAAVVEEPVAGAAAAEGGTNVEHAAEAEASDETEGTSATEAEQDALVEQYGYTIPTAAIAEFCVQNKIKPLIPSPRPGDLEYAAMDRLANDFPVKHATSEDFQNDYRCESCRVLAAGSRNLFQAQRVIAVQTAQRMDMYMTEIRALKERNRFLEDQAQRRQQQQSADAMQQSMPAIVAATQQ